MSLRRAVLQRITPAPSRTPSPSPNILPDWPQSPVESDPDPIAHPIAPDEHLATSARGKTPYVLFLCSHTASDANDGRH